MNDTTLLPLLEKHLGLRARRDDTVINPKTGHFTDRQRYRDLVADIEAHARQPENRSMEQISPGDRT